MVSFRVQSGKKYTRQKKFTLAAPVVPVTIMRYAMTTTTTTNIKHRQQQQEKHKNKIETNQISSRKRVS